MGITRQEMILPQMPTSAHVRFRGRKWVHTRPCSKDRTRGHTRQNRGRFSWGCYHYPRSIPHVHEHPRAGYQNGKLCRFWALVGCAPEERRKPSGQRCAYARRCPEASRPRWAAQLCCRCSFSTIYQNAAFGCFVLIPFYNIISFTTATTITGIPLSLSATLHSF